MSRSTLIAVYMAAMFLSGVVVGGFGYRLYTASSVTAGAPRRNPEDMRRAYVQEMQGRLQLEAAQVQQLNTILDETRARYRGFREKHKAELDDIQGAQVARIRAILSEPQRVEYERFRAEREKRMKGRKGD